MGSSMSPVNHIILKMEMGPTVHSPLSRKLERLTDACRCNYKGNTFSSVISRPWALVRSEARSLDLLVSCMRAMSRMSHDRRVKTSQNVYKVEYPLGLPDLDFICSSGLTFPLKWFWKVLLMRDGWVWRVTPLLSQSFFILTSSVSLV